MEAQGSRGSSGLPICSNSIDEALNIRRSQRLMGLFFRKPGNSILDHLGDSTEAPFSSGARFDGGVDVARQIDQLVYRYSLYYTSEWCLGPAY